METDTKKLSTYRELSISERLRVARHLTKGEAPKDPYMAVAAVELAESYRAHGRVHMTLVRWLPVFSVVVFGAISIPAAIAGSVGMTVMAGLLALGAFGHLVFNPAVRPKHAAQALEASKQVVPSGR